MKRAAGTFQSIRRKLERAARNGERLHLTPAEVRALVISPVYTEMVELARAELVASLSDDNVTKAKG